MFVGRSDRGRWPRSAVQAGYVRHLTDIDDALDTFFDPDRQSVWNEQHRRWETQSAARMLYWTWLEEDKKVLVISCFEL